MTTPAAVDQLLDVFRAVTSFEALEDALSETSAQLGFRYYAMVLHVDFAGTPPLGARLHNYPDAWVDWFDRRGLGPVDPVHRASHTCLTAFDWRDLPSLIEMTAQDREVLDRAHGYGLARGITVPAHIPGELLGSCSFVADAESELDSRALPYAQLAGQFAFEAKRRLGDTRPFKAGRTLTARQLECIMYVGRGKTDGEIAQILGVSPATVIEHLRHARERYNAAARAVLPLRALFDGALSFADMLAR